jgi:hypothetical protein
VHNLAFDVELASLVLKLAESRRGSARERQRCAVEKEIAPPSREKASPEGIEGRHRPGKEEGETRRRRLFRRRPMLTGRVWAKGDLGDCNRGSLLTRKTRKVGGKERRKEKGCVRLLSSSQSRPITPERSVAPADPPPVVAAVPKRV